MAELTVPSIDFSVLGNLGKTYDEAKAKAVVKRVGPRLADGSITYKQAAGEIAEGGNLDDTLRFLTLSEAEKKRTQEEAASAEFAKVLGGYYGQPQAAPAASNPVLPPSSAPGSNLKPVGGAQESPAPAAVPPQAGRIPVPSTPRVWGDAEAEAAGLYDAPAKLQPISLAGLGQPGPVGSPSPIAPARGLTLASLGDVPGAPGQVNSDSAGPRVAQSQSQPQMQQQPAQAAPQSDQPIPVAPQPNTPPVPVLIAATSNPRLPQAQRDVAKALLGKALDAGELTGTQKDYALYQRQGGKLDFFNYQKELKGPMVNIDQRGETEEAKAIGKAAGERAGEAMKAAAAAPKVLQNLNRMEQMLQLVKTGKLEPGRMTVSAWAKAFGVDDTVAERLGLDPKSIGTGQAISALSNELTLGNIGPGGLPANNFSNADRAFVEKIVPQLANDPEANSLMIEAKRRLVNLDIEKSKAWVRFRRDAGNKKLGFDDFESDWNDQVARRDLFGDLSEKAKSMTSAGPASGSPAAPQSAAGSQPPVPGARQAPDGNWYIQQNGKTYRVIQ